MDLESCKIRYVARLIEKVPTKPGCWEYSRVGVYEQQVGSYDAESKTTPILSEKQVGEYQRNYGFYSKTFFPFMKNGKWYALYSKEYMYTRVMSLPDCIDLGGEDSSNTEYSNHFCPMAYYVPELCVQEFKSGEVDPRPLVPNHDYHRWCKNGRYPDDKNSTHTEEEKKEYKELYERQHRLLKEWHGRHPFVTKHAEFGFVEGCMWGDDSSGKLEVLDLREVEKGIIKRSANFGYFTLPRNCELHNVIDDDHIEGEELRDWSKVTLYLAKPVRVQLDGSFAGWWVDEYFKKLGKKYDRDLTPGQLDKLEEIFKFFYTKGLDDGSASSAVEHKIVELIDCLLYKRVEVKYKEVSFFKHLFSKIKSKVFNKFFRY